MSLSKKRKQYDQDKVEEEQILLDYIKIKEEYDGKLRSLRFQQHAYMEQHLTPWLHKQVYAMLCLAKRKQIPLIGKIACIWVCVYHTVKFKVVQVVNKGEFKVQLVTKDDEKDRIPCQPCCPTKDVLVQQFLGPITLTYDNEQEHCHLPDLESFRTSFDYNNRQYHAEIMVDPLYLIAVKQLHSCLKHLIPLDIISIIGYYYQHHKDSIIYDYCKCADCSDE